MDAYNDRIYSEGQESPLPFFGQISIAPSNPEPIITEFNHLDDFIRSFEHFKFKKPCIERVFCCIKPSIFEKLTRLNNPSLNIDYKNRIIKEILKKDKRLRRIQFLELSIVKLCLIACILENSQLATILSGDSEFVRWVCRNVDTSIRNFEINKQLLPSENTVNWFFKNIIIFVTKEVQNGLAFKNEILVSQFQRF